MIHEMVGPGPYCLPHIVFLLIAVPLLIAGIILVIKFVKQEKSIKLLVKITAATLLLLIIVNRVAYTYQRVVEYGGVVSFDGEKTYYNWGYLLPDTFCALSAFLLSISALVFKKNNVLFHAVTYFGLFSGLAATFFPAYLSTQGFFEVGTITSLIYHVVLVFLAATIVLKQYLIPTIKRWYVPPIVYAFFCVIAFFEVQILDTPERDAMSLYHPLVKQLPHLTSWYAIGLEFTFCIIVVLFIYERVMNHKSFKTTICEMLFIEQKKIIDSTNVKINHKEKINEEKKEIKLQVKPVKKVAKISKPKKATLAKKKSKALNKKKKK